MEVFSEPLLIQCRERINLQKDIELYQGGKGEVACGMCYMACIVHKAN